MGIKSLRLRRSNIFYPTNGDMRNLHGLLSDIVLTDEYLEDILEIEDSFYSNSKQAVWPNDLESLLKRAKKETKISTKSIEKIFFHILRNGSTPRTVTKADYPALISAYERLFPELKEETVLHKAYFDTYQALFLFGKIGAFQLSEKNPPEYDDYIEFTKAWSQFNKYLHMGGMAAKIDRFLPFASSEIVVARIADVLRVTNHQHMRTKDPSHYNYTQLYYWGMLITLLLSKERRFKTIDEFFSFSKSIPLFETHVDRLGFFIDAINDLELKKYFQIKKKAKSNLINRIFDSFTKK